MLAATLDVVKEDELSVNPLLVQFTNGDVIKNCQDQLKLTLYKSLNSEDIRKKHRRTLEAETSKMKYTGSNFGMAARSSSLCKYLVGVYNKKTETMKVYDTTRFQLQPKTSSVFSGRVRHQQQHREDDEVDNKDSNANLSFTEKNLGDFEVEHFFFIRLYRVIIYHSDTNKNDRLVEAFGSTKRKRAMKSRLQNVIDSEDLGQSVSNAVSHMLSQPGQEAPSNEAEHDMLPRFNKNADNPAQIYPLSSILEKKDFDALKSPVLEFITEIPNKLEAWKREKTFSQYVLDHIAILPVNEADRNKKASLLLFFSYLVQFYQLNYQALRRKDPLPDVPEAIKIKLFSLFSLQNEKSRCVPKRLKDKLVFHIVVLALIIDGFTIDCAVLCKDLKMALQRFTNYAKAVGCTIESSQGIRKRKLDEDSPSVSKRAVLTAPLPNNFPDHMPIFARKKT